MSDVEPQTVRRSRVLPGLLLVLLVFAGGAGFWAWASQNWFPKDAEFDILGSPNPPSTSKPVASQIVVQPNAPSATSDIESLSDRLRVLETVPSLNASQSISIAAERLVLILATRRAIERGVPHVPMANALAGSFPSQQTTFLPAVIQNSANPAGVAALVQEFDALKPQLSKNSDSWMDRFSDLAVIRSKTSEQASPTELVAKVEAALQLQDLARAAKLLSQHPARLNATQWLARANAHAAAMRSLDALETLALETPTAPSLSPPAGPENSSAASDN